MPADIFLSDYDPGTNHHLVVESDHCVVWAYLLTGDTQQILMDGIVCSLIEPAEDWGEAIDKTKPPPLLKRFANTYSVLPQLREDQFRIQWTGHEVRVYIDETLYLVMDLHLRTSRSKALSLAGRYGLPLEDK
ncbi:MAG TPA: hypothetical protein VKQ08_11695 [Cyclobacteriaceae bacterium]|nr:hypothetical protein [Cyclobacteriaceae bacterium]